MKKNNFNDHFAEQAKTYSKFRPHYPEELFQYIATLSQRNDLAWDCASGSGQAAIGLARYFNKVIASDVSPKQIEHSIPNPKIIYKIFPSEKPDIEDNSIDLVAIAHSLHWLKINKFYTSAKRVMKPDGIIAVWFYRLLNANPGINKIINRFHKKILKDYWLPQRKMLDNNYSDIPFPFKKLYSPKFEMKSRMSFDDLTGYLSTWSAVQRYSNATGKDPIKIIANDLLHEFEDPDNLIDINWPLTLWVGKNTN